MKHMKKLLAILLSLALLLAASGAIGEDAEIAEECEEALVEAPAEEPVEEFVEEPVEEPAEEFVEAPAEEPAEAPAPEDAEISEALVEEGEFALEAEPFNASEDGFTISKGVLTGYTGSAAEVVIPSSVKTIGEGAFSGNRTMTSVYIPDSVTAIGSEAFYGCTALREVRMSNKVKTLDAHTFERCTSLRSFAFPEGFTETDSGTFLDCTSLESVTLPSTLKSIGAFDYAGCTSLRSIEIPNGVKFIFIEAFRGCTALESVRMPASLDGKLGSIGMNELVSVFADCDSLKEITVSSLFGWMSYTFEDCDKLETVRFLENEKTDIVLQDTFSNCPNLKAVYVPLNCEAVESGVFQNCPDVTVYLYKGSLMEEYCIEYGIPYQYRESDVAVSCTPESCTLTQKESVTLSPSTTGLREKEGYTYDNSAKEVVTVSKSGKITAKNPGTATITVTGKKSKQRALCKVTVIPAPTKVSIEKPSKAEYTTDDAPFSLAASVEPADAVQSVKWTSSDETVARVSAEGLVTLVGQGKATITAKSEKKGTNGKQRTDTFVLNVEDLHMPANVKIVEKASGPVYVDKDKPLTLHYAMDPVKEGQTASSAVTWSIPKAKERKIATINAETGEITPIKEGSATVKITTQKKGGTGSKKKQLTDTVKITVVDPTKPRTVQINEGEKEIPLYYEAGKTLELKATIEPATATQGVKWSISSKTQRKIATVDSATGVVTPTGTKFGVVTVKVETTAKKSNKKAATATIKIAVVDPKYPYSVKITQEDGSELQDGVELKVGQTLKLSAHIEPETAIEKTGINWSISKSQKKYATVDKDGTVTGVKAGKTVTITAKTANGKKATIKIKIVQ